LGSTRALTDDGGDATDTYVYDAWGNEVAVSGSTVNPFRWVGQVGYYFDDETGTFYVRARVYEPVTGRWMSMDPLFYRAKARLRSHGTGHDAPNVHAYVGCAPLSWADPSGMKPPNVIILPPVYGENNGDLLPPPVIIELPAPDPWGLNPFGGQTGEMTEEEFFQWFWERVSPTIENYPPTAGQVGAYQDAFKDLLHQGCVGVVGVMLGAVSKSQAFLHLKTCYRSLVAAKKTAAKWKKEDRCCKYVKNGIEKLYKSDIFGGKPLPRIIFLQFANRKPDGTPEIATFPPSEIDPEEAYDLTSQEIAAAIIHPKTVPNFDFKLLDEKSEAWWGTTDYLTGARKISAISDLQTAIAEGEDVGMNEEFYCATCEQGLE